MKNTGFKLKIKEKRQETKDSCSLIFEFNGADPLNFQYKAGQFVSLDFDINGQTARRSYSISSAPHEDEFKVSVKRVKNGLVSNHIMDNLNQGDEVMVLPPEGVFTFEPLPSLSRSYFLFAAGSGITPIFSILKDILENEPLSKVFLFYGNKTEADTMFKSRLDDLEKTYQGQLSVFHAYSKTKGFFGRLKKSPWTQSNRVDYGRIDDKKLANVFTLAKEEIKGESIFYLCGPEAMIFNVEKYLLKNGILPKQVLKELFSTSVSADAGTEANVELQLDGETHHLLAHKGQTLLDAFLDNDIDISYSCRSGSCSSCVGKLLEGEVRMDNYPALDEDEIADGYILCCQAVAKSDKIKVDLNA